jgi:site-specific recombinase XerD
MEDLQQQGQAGSEGVLSLEEDERIDLFRRYLQATRAKQTAKVYVFGARKFEEFLEEKGVDFYGTTPGLTNDFVVWLSEDGLTSNTISTLVVGAKRYVSWLRSHNKTIPEFETPDMPRITHKKQYTPSVEEVAKYLLASKELRQPIRTLLLLLPYCGMRIGAMCALPVSSIEIGKDNNGVRYFVFRTVGKGDKENIVPLIPPGDALLSDYWMTWRKKKISDWLFPGRIAGVSISRDFCWKQMNILRDAIGCPRLTPHALRRYYATRLQNMGVDIITIANVLGHTDIKTTAKYYINPSIKDVLTKLSNREE